GQQAAEQPTHGTGADDDYFRLVERHFRFLEPGRAKPQFAVICWSIVFEAVDAAVNVACGKSSVRKTRRPSASVNHSSR
ncbi:MAG: hypothetical protein ABL904_02880, partial [Hyphomicrobiaceae bacterium]